MNTYSEDTTLVNYQKSLKIKAIRPMEKSIQMRKRKTSTEVDSRSPVKRSKKASNKLGRKLKHQKIDYPTTNMRNKPAMLSKVIANLSSKKQQWLRDAGFGSMLYFTLFRQQHRIGYFVLNAYDHEENKVVFENDEIPICEEDVEAVLGFPRGTKPIVLESKVLKTDRELLWRAQFATKSNQMWKICTSNVYTELMASAPSPNVDELFKLNFLVLLSSTLIMPLASAYANQSLLYFKGNIDELAQYNWCAFVINQLKVSKANWNRNGCYAGPLLFLIVNT